MGRALDRVIAADVRSAALALARQAVREFRAFLDGLHNDSTGISILVAHPNGALRKTHLPPRCVVL
jgi:hypothetical protein